jgi:hypothetical protein
MQTKHLFLLPALAFLACAGLHAQVTIGGLENPKGGAILDLNSDVKGGLVLSNVYLENQDTVPASFPGVATANATELKAGLKGAVIYNINPDICTGVHVWNGNFWERITKAPVSAAGTLIMKSDPKTLFGGGEVEFTATPGAKIYRWYASRDDAPYEYIGLTTEPAFSERFPAGNNKVKVIMDDCNSLKKSNERLFSMGNISPPFGSLAGGNIIYIYGDFPYAATSEYAAPEDLVAHFDGINNQGLGDKQHSFDPDAWWKDLKSGLELPRKDEAAGKWLSNGFQALDEDTSFFYSGNFPSTYPLSNHERTVEVIFRTPAGKDMFVQKKDVQRVIFQYGRNSPAMMFGVLYRGLEKAGSDEIVVCPEEYLWIFYAISGNTNNLLTCLFNTPSLMTPDTINTVTSTYAESMQNTTYTNSYINNQLSPPAYRQGDSLKTPLSGNMSIGGNLSHSTFLSVRLYNRVLNSTEIAKNAALDQIRYLNPPTVTIDDRECTEVVVLSPHFLMCRVPAGLTGTGDRQVKLNGKNYTNYTYVDSVAGFYISSISPIVGPLTGTTLTLKGNRLDEIDKVEVDGMLCTLTSKSSGEYKCTLPAVNSAGEVDIVITTTGEETYRFAKVFEYQ